ncbi:hypothetical protein HMPREF9069_00515 [Atopobium sp. oral taxon 810 str. F0209]|nr:hypothetical protein HMPREF9069_00515 [Atopobium sp. oral taxon 810 str. F0209]
MHLDSATSNLELLVSHVREHMLVFGTVCQQWREMFSVCQEGSPFVLGDVRRERDGL